MESYEKVKRAIDRYLEIEDLQENQLYIGIQLDKQDDSSFSIDYYIKGRGEPVIGFIAPEFGFEDEKKALNEYMNHLPEIYQEYPEATKSVAGPELYEPFKPAEREHVKFSPVADGGAVMYDPQNKNERFIDCEEALNTREWV